MGYYYQAAYGGLIIYVIIIVAIACVFGFATKKIIENKGYSENWFWWGFFFWLIAVLVALSKPDINNRYNQYNTPNGRPPLSSGAGAGNYTSPLSKAAAETQKKQQENVMLRNGGWRCSRCETVNPSTNRVCSKCTLSKEYSENWVAIQEKESKEKQELENAQKIKAYKDLLDSGAITQEEFDKKKAELLNL